MQFRERSMQPSAVARRRGVWFLHPHHLPYPIHITWSGSWDFGSVCWNFKPLTEERCDLVEKAFDMFALIFSMQWNTRVVDGNQYLPECRKRRSSVKNAFVAFDVFGGMTAYAHDAGDFQINCFELFKEFPIWRLPVNI
jgi:hypothetical protein